MMKNNAKHRTFLLATAFVISTISMTSAYAHNPPYEDDYWFNYNGDPEVCYLTSQLNGMTVDGSTNNASDVENAVELTRAEYNSEIDGLTIAADDGSCGYNSIEVGAKSLTWPILAQTTPSVNWSNGDYADREVDFSTNINWEINSNACDWLHDKDVEWLANHEFGHALSIDHHSGSGTVMDSGCHSDYASVDSESENALEARY